MSTADAPHGRARMVPPPTDKRLSRSAAGGSGGRRPWVSEMGAGGCQPWPPGGEAVSTEWAVGRRAAAMTYQRWDARCQPGRASARAGHRGHGGGDAARCASERDALRPGRRGGRNRLADHVLWIMGRPRGRHERGRMGHRAPPRAGPLPSGTSSRTSGPRVPINGHGAPHSITRWRVPQGVCPGPGRARRGPGPPPRSRPLSPTPWRGRARRPSPSRVRVWHGRRGRHRRRCANGHDRRRRRRPHHHSLFARARAPTPRPTAMDAAAAAADAGPADPLPPPPAKLASAMDVPPPAPTDDQAAEWLNTAMTALWPYMDAYLCRLVADVGQAALSAALPGWLGRLEVSEVSFGNAPPRLDNVVVVAQAAAPPVPPAAARSAARTAAQAAADAGARTTDSDRDSDSDSDGEAALAAAARGVTLQADLHFAAADAVVGVDLVTALFGRLRLGVRSPSIDGRVVVTVRPLVPVLPLAGGLSAAFVSPPAVGFDLTGWADVDRLPAVRAALRRAVGDVLGGVAVLPARVGATLDGSVDFFTVRGRAAREGGGGGKGRCVGRSRRVGRGGPCGAGPKRIDCHPPVVRTAGPLSAGTDVHVSFLRGVALSNTLSALLFRAHSPSSLLAPLLSSRPPIDIHPPGRHPRLHACRRSWLPSPAGFLIYHRRSRCVRRGPPRGTRHPHGDRRQHHHAGLGAPRNGARPPRRPGAAVGHVGR